MSATATVDMDFSPVESFHILLKNLWSMNIAYRIKLNVVDTILFRDGVPYYWIFTSDQTGEIMKKKAERMESNPEIIRCLKQKSRAYTGSKEVELRNKVAVVWYQETDKNVLSWIVDEAELKTILNSSIQEIMCIQPYIGSISFRGSGVFEHRVFTQKDGTLKHITYEMLCEKGHTIIFTTTSDEVEKWVVTEHQHGALMSIAKQLITHMGFMNKCKVSNLVIQCVFSEQWVPHIVACKRVAFTSLPQSLASKKDELIYPNGRAPPSVMANPNSILPKSDTNNMFNRKQSTLPAGSTTTSTLPATSTTITNGTITTTLSSTINTIPSTTNFHSTANIIASTNVILPTPQLIPPAPLSPAMSPSAKMSPSTKIRRSSVTYDTQTTYYSHYNNENERRAAALQRQSSIKAELYIADAIEEARNIANETTSSGKFKRQGSTRTLSPPRSRRASYDIEEKDNKDTSETGDAFKDVNSPAQGASSRKSFVGVSKNSPKRSSSGSKLRRYPTDRRDTIQQNKRFAPDENSTSNPTSRGTSPTNDNSPNNSTKYITSYRYTNNGSIKQNTSPAPKKRSSMMAKIPDFHARHSIIDTTTTTDSIGVSLPSRSAPLTRALTSVQSNPNIPSFTPTFARHHTITSIPATPQTTNEALDISTMVIPAIDPTREPSKVNYNTTDYYATVHMTGKPSTYNALQLSKGRQTITTVNNGSSRNNSLNNSRNNSSFNLFQSINPAMNTTSEVPRRASSATTRNKRMSTMTINTTATGTNPFNETNAVNVTTANAIANRVFHPDSANSVSKLRKTVEKINCAEGASTGLISAIPSVRRASTANNTSNTNNNNTYANTAYITSGVEATTEARLVNTTYYKQHIEVNDEINLKKLDRVFSDRRPISAPNISRAHVASAERKRHSEKDLFGDELHYTGDPKDQVERHPHSKGNVVGKILPFTGVLCHGGYCDFKERAKNAAQNEKESRSHLPSSHCTYKLAYKSIILCKAETKFLGLEIDENIESLLDQIRLSNVSMEQLYTYFVRRHLNKIAQRVQDEAKRLQAENAKLDPAVQQSTEIDTVYRGLVYADALNSIHPSRFYITVPVCQMCYQIYTYLDSERDTIVLNNINQQTLALHTAEMQMEKERFRLFAKSGSGSHGRKHGTLRGMSGSGRRKSERRRSSMIKAAKDSNPHNELAPAEEDPYQVDDTVYTDAFVPHHTAQRDIYSDSHKKDNFASTLRNNVANIQFYADQAMSMVVQNNHADVVNIHNVNNVDDGTLTNHRKQKSRSRSNSPRKATSRPNSPTSAIKRQIVYDTIDNGHLEAHVQESTVLSAKKTATDTNTTTASTHTAADPIVHFHTNTTQEADNTLSHPQHATRRKALLYRDNIPVNTKDVTIHNTTHDSGIGSKGPIVKQVVNNSIKPVATLSKWVNMLHSGTVHNLYTSLNTNAMYDTNQQWDAQGNVPYTKNTLSADYRIQATKLRRPQSANNIPTKPQHSNSTTSGSTVYGILQPAVVENVNNEAEPVRVSPTPTHTPVPIQNFANAIARESGISNGKTRPTSAGPIPYRSAPQNRPVRLTKEETIRVLENNVASQMLHLADFLKANRIDNDNEVLQKAEFPFTTPAAASSNNQVPSTNYASSNNNIIMNHNAGSNSVTGDKGMDLEEDLSNAYAYTSLPFMAAPYLPSRPFNSAAVADAAFTQLQIDPKTQTIIQPTLTPAQIEQKKRDEEQAMLQEQINQQRRQIELQRQAEYEQLQKDRAELAQAHRDRANSVYTATSVNINNSNSLHHGTHPRVSFVQQLHADSGSTMNSPIHSAHNSPAQRRKRHVSISAGPNNRRGSTNITNRRNSYAGNAVGKNADSTHFAPSKGAATGPTSTDSVEIPKEQIEELTSLMQLQLQLNRRHEEELQQQKQNAPVEVVAKNKSASSSRASSAKNKVPTVGAIMSAESGDSVKHGDNKTDASAIKVEDEHQQEAPVVAYEVPEPLDLRTINSVQDSITTLGFSPMSPPLFEHFQDSTVVPPVLEDEPEVDNNANNNTTEDGFDATIYAQYFQDAPKYGLDNDNDASYDAKPENTHYSSSTPFMMLASIPSAPPSFDAYDHDNRGEEVNNYTEPSIVQEPEDKESENNTDTIVYGSIRANSSAMQGDENFMDCPADEIQPQQQLDNNSATGMNSDRIEDVDMYTDNGSSGDASAHIAEPVSNTSNILSLEPPTATDTDMYSSSAIATELSIPVMHTPVYIHDLHTSTSFKNIAPLNTNDETDTTINRAPSPFPDLHVSLVPPSPHAHSPPARAHAKVLETSVMEKSFCEEDV